jgi:hypothetical protein
LDALEEECNIARARSAIYKQKARRYHSREFRAKEFNIGALVMRLHPKKQKHKLSPKWAGPFIIDQVLIGGAYRIRDPTNGHLETSPWNAALLRRFYG